MIFIKKVKCVISTIVVLALILTTMAPVATANAAVNKTTITTVTENGVTYTINTTDKGGTYTTMVTSDANENVQVITYSDKVLYIEKKTLLKTNNGIKEFSFTKDEVNLKEEVNTIETNIIDDPEDLVKLLSTWNPKVTDKWKDNYYYQWGFEGCISKVMVGGDGYVTIKTWNTLSNAGREYINTHINKIDDCNKFMVSAIVAEGPAIAAEVCLIIGALVLTGGLAAPVVISLVGAYTTASAAAIINAYNAYQCYGCIQNNFNNALYAN